MWIMNDLDYRLIVSASKLKNQKLQSEIRRLLLRESFYKIPLLTELYHLIYIGEL